jgi:twitching motility protein PilT
VSTYDPRLENLVAELNRSAHGHATPAHNHASAHPPVPIDTSSLDRVLAQAVRRAASDVLIIAGTPVMLRIAGALTSSAGPPLDADESRALLLGILTPAQQQELHRARSIDLCFSRDGIGRFRANIHHQRGTLSGSFRLLPESIPSLDSLHLPNTLRRLAEARQGLVLITGPTGCGKSSTLAALVDLINTNRHHHVVTIEDPIEFVHTNRNSVIEQIEVGPYPNSDAPDFATSLRSILRQSPDVILVGEMRDPETIATALTAAETGHLVLSTLHTNDTAQAVARILDSFPAGNQHQIRQQVSLALLAVVAQQLVPTPSGDRYPACEILMATHAVRSLIRKGEDHQLYSTVSTSRSAGMITMEQSLAEMVRFGRITQDVALAHCLRPLDLERHLNDT